MANLSKIKRDNMIAFLEQLKQEHADDASIRAFNEIENHLREKKYGLVWEEHSEEVDELLAENIPILTADPDRRLCKDENLPWNFIIEGDNLQALYLLEKTHKGKVDCIYIDPPYNNRNRSWKYNNDYVDENDVYKHSMWLSMMKERLFAAKKLLNPTNSVLICTIDEKEFAHLGCLLEEIFPTARIQMVSSIINRQGVARDNEFARVNEYIYVVMIGGAYPARLPLSKEWLLGSEKTLEKKNEIYWSGLLRRGSNNTRTHSPGCFYPIVISKKTNRVVYVGGITETQEDINKKYAAHDHITCFPYRPDGTEGCWQLSADKFIDALDQGYVKFGKPNKRQGLTLYYLARGERAKIENGIFRVVGRSEVDGSVIVEQGETFARHPANNQWSIASHDASQYGTILNKKFLVDRKFPYPKSLYAVRDIIRFFISDKPNAVVVDFFAGSGTTLHAVNLLNAVDGGKRTCIMVTNNEISEAEENDLKAKGYKKGDKKWEDLGIAKYVTWPRTVCSINGVNVKGVPIDGCYGVDVDVYERKDTPGHESCYVQRKVPIYPELANIKIADGFQSNVKYFKCDWTPRKPEDYLLSNALCLHIREMIELQNAIEVDNVKNVLILNKSDFKNFILNPDIYAQIENVWVNQNIVLNAEELKLLEAKGFKYIPREFFGQELREASE